MHYGKVDGVEKRISRVVMGVDNQADANHMRRMADDFVERGGTAFDTAHIYGGGKQESLLGGWMQERGAREDVVVLGKGAHSPNCFPEAVTSELHESLERLQSDYVDLYLLHRDNPEVPAGEFVDVLNEHRAAGRMRAFGGSNWTAERVDAANDYARENGLEGFSAISNNFSLARMVKPVWRGCIAASEPEFRKWLARTQMPNFAWSSQARGFFTDRAGPDKREDESLVESWYSAENFERRRRAYEMAERRGCEPINIALAYVLCQPFPSFALIGPRKIEETESSLRALDVQLTEDELAWLDLRD